MKRALAFALGTAADWGFGDPPTRWHPVGLIGSASAALRPLAPADDAARYRFGLVVALGLPVAAALAAIAVRRAARPLPLGGVIADAVVLASATSLRTLLGRAREIEAALTIGDLEDARRLCGMHLVSRDTSELDASEVAAATIESVAENLSDGVIAPWLAFALAGAPGAAAYRVANTMDALWGYHTPEFELLGRAAARLDDILNLAPARVTAFAIALAAATPAYGGQCSVANAFATWRADAGRTESPNAGHPMATMAGALGITLAKRGAYTLGGGHRSANASDIGRAVRLAQGAAVLTGAGLLGAQLAIGAAT